MWGGDEVLSAAQKTSDQEPILPIFLSGEEKWRVATCLRAIRFFLTSTMPM